MYNVPCQKEHKTGIKNLCTLKFIHTHGMMVLSRHTQTQQKHVQNKHINLITAHYSRTPYFYSI